MSINLPVNDPSKASVFYISMGPVLEPLLDSRRGKPVTHALKIINKMVYWVRPETNLPTIFHIYAIYGISFRGIYGECMYICVPYMKQRASTMWREGLYIYFKNNVSCFLGIYHWTNITAAMHIMLHSPRSVWGYRWNMVHVCAKTKSTATFISRVTATHVVETNMFANLYIYRIFEGHI